MKIAGLGVVILSLSCWGCAHRQASATAEARVVELPLHQSQVNRGQPIPHAEMAGDLAELVLAESGIDTRGFARAVSYSDDRYLVTFTNQLADGRTLIFTVELDARDSTTRRLTRRQFGP